jgi:hypothetical protein
MSKFIVLIALIVAGGSAAAEWLPMGKSAGDGFDYYVDLATFRKEGERVMLWVVYDYAAPQAVFDKPYLSSKLQFEFDCKEKGARILNTTVHAENMGKGEAITSTSLSGSEREPLAAGSIQERLWKVTCGSDWVKLALEPTFVFDIYVVPASISRSGNLVKMWGLYDYKIPQVMAGEKRYSSQKTQNEYDCKDERLRTISYLRHPGKMGDGNPIFTSDGPPGAWTSAASGSVQKRFWNAACGK